MELAWFTRAGLLHDTRKTREHVLPQLGPLPTFTPRFLMQNPSIYHLIHPLSSPNLPEAPHLCLLSFYLFVLLGWPCPLSSPRQPSRSSVPGGSQGRVCQEAQSPLEYNWAIDTIRHRVQRVE
ncbi:hypothetical protein CNBG_5915 [Cryptococcus deuterogattii R265]|uniref:uncharacterized protein n=1 Tax=Cryptococcus deuterogattii (strain R265) TaxID=294750 RepID=UPI001935655E|nr:hypothetical protein CNBG_5915 [Cryptococcus deuterogattii R265]